MEILSPRSDLEQREQAAERIADFSGKKLVALWNGRRPGPTREVLEGVLKRLDQRHGLASWDVVQKPFVGNAAPEDLLREVVASGADGVLTGLGD